MIFMTLSEPHKDFMERLYEDHRTTMWRYAYSLTQDSELSSDLVHTAFLRFMDHVETLERLTRRKLNAYIAITIHNLVINHWRGEQDTEDIAEVELPDQSSADVYSGSLTMLNIEAAVGLLTDREREIIALRYGHDLDYAAIAHMLGISLEAARVRFHRAKARLKALLMEMEGKADEG